jgi:hypothetical protein
MPTPRQGFASQVAMRGKLTCPMRTAGRSRNALVRRHARLTPQESRPLRLDAPQRQRSVSRELPSIYLFSVGREKCVAGSRKYFEALQKVSVVRRRGQTPCVQFHCSSRSRSLRSAHVRALSALGRDGKPKALKDDTPSRKRRGWSVRADSFENLTRDLLDSLHALSQ